MYIHLNDLFVDFPGTHAAAFGAGETLTPGVYYISAAGSVDGALTLNGGGNENARFVITFNGAFTVGAASVITLTNGTKAANVFFIANGAIAVAADAKIIGTLFSKTGAVGLGANATLEGRMLTMAGAITAGVGAVVSPPTTQSTIQIFCEPQCNPAPAVDVLRSLSNFALFSSSGAVANTGITGMNGNVGTNAGTVTGYSGGVHIGSEQIMNSTTAQAALDLDAAYNDLMALPVTGTHSATFLNNETVDAGVYDISGAASLGGTVTLDAAGDPNAIFVIRVAGAFNIAAGAKIILANGARRCNVFWIGGAGVATGAVNIGAAAIVKGTFISHGGACNTGGAVFLSGRQFSTLGAINTDTGVVYINPECVTSASLALPNAPTITTIQPSCTTQTGTITITAPVGVGLSYSIDGTNYQGESTFAGLSTGTYSVTVRNSIAKISEPTVVVISPPTITIWNGTSWSNGYPSQSNSAVFEGNFTTSADIETCSITVNAGATIVVSSGYNITLTGALMIDALGSFTLNNNSNLLQREGAANTGIITVKRESSPLYRLDSTLWSSPVAGQNTRNFSPATLANRFYFYDCAASVNGAYAPLFNNSQFPNIVEATYTFEPAKAYLIRAPNTYAPYIPAVSPATTSAVSGVKYLGQFSGTPNNGTINSTLDTALNGYNLVGNPYPSSISLQSFLQENSNMIDGTIWLWRKINDLGTGVGYATMTTAGVTSIQQGISEQISNGVIRTGEGFFVKTKTNLSAASLVFKNEMRSGDVSNLFFKNQNTGTAEKHRIWLNLSNATETIGQNLIGYISGATDGFDYSFDGKSFGNNAISLSSIIANSNYNIQARSVPFQSDDVVLLNFKTNIAGTYNISIDHLDGIFATDQDIFLKDNLTGNLQNLKQSAYSFDSQIGNFDTRFEIVYQNQLEINNPLFDSNHVVIYNQNGTIYINSGKVVMDTIEIYDSSGRMLFSKANVNATTENLSKLPIANQLLILKIKSVDALFITKKILY